MGYRVFLPFVAKAPPPPDPPKPWHKRGTAGFTWSKVPPQYRWAGLKITWGHSWGLARGVREGVECVPMIWGLTRPAHPHYGLDYAIANLPHDYNGWLLVLNEPADEAQANLTPEEGAYLWRRVCEVWPLAQLVGPQMLAAMDGQPFFDRAKWWFAGFWGLLSESERARCAAHSYHVYLNFADEHTHYAKLWMNWCDNVAGSRPYWVSEWGVNGDWHVDGGYTAVKQIAAWYDNEPRVARHAYYIPYVSGGNGWDDAWVSYRLFDDDGVMTGQGRAWLDFSSGGGV